MSVATEGFRALATGMRDLGDELCESRLLVFRESGYSLYHMPLCALAVVETIAGVAPSFTSDPIEFDLSTTLGQAGREAASATRS